MAEERCPSCYGTGNCTLCEGRSFQLGEGWHSSEHPVYFWNPLPRILKEAGAQCYACTTAYAMMIRLCNVC